DDFGADLAEAALGEVDLLDAVAVAGQGGGRGRERDAEDAAGDERDDALRGADDFGGVAADEKTPGRHRIGEPGGQDAARRVLALVRKKRQPPEQRFLADARFHRGVDGVGRAHAAIQTASSGSRMNRTATRMASPAERPPKALSSQRPSSLRR